MNDYILERLRCDANHAINLSKNESKLQHSGLKGRFRELLVDNILTPWLPPYAKCGTGMIIATLNQKRDYSQDDIIVYDESLVPPVLASNNAPEGVFLYNSVLARIEVKSTLTRAYVREFVQSSLEVANLLVTVHKENTSNFEGAYNLLFAFNSDSEGKNNEDFEVQRLAEVMKEEGVDILSGIVSMICVVGKGFWKIGLDDKGNREWKRLNSSSPLDHIVWFLGCTSSTCFNAHALRVGRDPKKGLETGIGHYIPDDVYVKANLK